MIVLRSRDVRRTGFTLIELLVVIAIIAVLVSLSAAGVMRILLKIPEVQTRTDIAEMDASIGSFMTDYNLSNPPPSALVLNETLSYQPGDPSGAFLRQVFGKNLGAGTSNPNSPGTPWVDWNGDGQPNGPWVLEGEQCLIFYLGGIQSMASGSPQCLGFSTNNMNPAMAGGARKGPYFNFQSARLVPLTALNPQASPFFVYIDGWKVQTGPKPYAFFSSRGVNNGYSGDCPSIGAAPYRDAAGNFTFSNKYQIISAGQNAAFGTGVWNPAAGAQDPGGRDDQANFSAKLLAAGQQ